MLAVIQSPIPAAIRNTDETLGRGCIIKLTYPNPSASLGCPVVSRWCNYFYVKTKEGRFLLQVEVSVLRITMTGH